MDVVLIKTCTMRLFPTLQQSSLKPGFDTLTELILRMNTLSGKQSATYSDNQCKTYSVLLNYPPISSPADISELCFDWLRDNYVEGRNLNDWVSHLICRKIPPNMGQVHAMSNRPIKSFHNQQISCSISSSHLLCTNYREFLPYANFITTNFITTVFQTYFEFG